MLLRKRSFNRSMFSPRQLVAIPIQSILVHQKRSFVRIIRVITRDHEVINEMSVGESEQLSSRRVELVEIKTQKIPCPDNRL